MTHEPQPIRSPARRTPWIITAIAAVAAIGAWIFATREGEPAPAPAAATPTAAAAAAILEQARERCDVLHLGTSIRDGGNTLIIDVMGRKDRAAGGLPPSEVDCLLAALEMPDAVREQIRGTRALDGRQTATWPGFSASWTYHPDQGLDAIITAS